MGTLNILMQCALCAGLAVAGTYASAQPAGQPAAPLPDAYWVPLWAHGGKREPTPRNPSAYAQSQRDAPAYGPRAAMPRPAPGSSSGWVLDQRSLGMQLDSGARETIRRRDGQQMLYYGNRF